MKKPIKKFQRHEGNFAHALGKLTKAKHNQRFALPSEAMDQRIKQGVDSDICKQGAWYNASFNEVNGRILATLDYNPLIPYAEQVVEAHRTGEFFLTDEVLLGNGPATQVLEKIAEQDARKPIHRKKVMDLGKIKTHDVPTDCFADDDTIAFLAQGKTRANNFGLFLKNKARIKNIRVYMQSLIGKNKSRGFWLCGVADGLSEFYCGGRSLYSDGGSLFGVYESAEGTSRSKTTSKIPGPSLLQVLRFSKSFIPPRDRRDYEAGLKELFEKQ